MSDKGFPVDGWKHLSERSLSPSDCRKMARIKFPSDPQKQEQEYQRLLKTMGVSESSQGDTFDFYG